MPPRAADADVDADTILDSDEGTGDADGDGVPNHRDADADGDGLADRVEAGDVLPDTFPVDHDGDGTPSFLDPDSDGAPPGDAVEMLGAQDRDSDLDGTLDAHDDDDDGDGVPDVAERVDATFRDSDGDGATDDRDPDSDDDGCQDGPESWWTAFSTEPFDADGDGLPDLRDLDSDDDGVPDLVECGAIGGVPADTDGDGWIDLRDEDADGDGVSDADEVAAGTDRLVRDTDGDGHSDGAERYVGSDPLERSSRAGAVYVEIEERAAHEVLLPIPAFGPAVDLVWILDSSCSTEADRGPLAAQANLLRAILVDEVPDVAWGLVGYQDTQRPQPSPASAPFYQVVIPVQADGDAVFSAMIGPYATSGKGDPEVIGFEAARQVAAGVGWDGLCNGVYNAAEDVAPFLASAGDLFDGTAECAVAEAALGTRGGVGFRDGSIAIGILMTDSYLRNPGYSFPLDPSFGEIYGGCPNDANEDIAAAAWVALGGAAVGLDLGDRPVAIHQFEHFAEKQGAVVDWTGDGVVEPAAMWASRTVSERAMYEDPAWVAEPLAAIVLALAEHLAPTRTLALEVSDPEGWVAAVTPAALVVGSGQAGAFSFEVSAPVAAGREDSVFVVPFRIHDGSQILLDQRLVVVLRGRPAQR